MQKIGGGVVNTNAIDGLIDLSLESVIDAPRKPLWKTAGWLRANIPVQHSNNAVCVQLKGEWQLFSVVGRGKR